MASSSSDTSNAYTSVNNVTGVANEEMEHLDGYLTTAVVAAAMTLDPSAGTYQGNPVYIGSDNCYYYA